MERLIPFEKLEEDYYLGENRGYGGGGADSDADVSSDDEDLDRELARLAGVRTDCGGIAKKKKKKKEVNEFEVSMEEELDGLITNYAQQFLLPPSVIPQAQSTVQRQKHTLKIEEIIEEEDDDMELRVVTSATRITKMKNEKGEQFEEVKREEKKVVKVDDEMPPLETSDGEEPMEQDAGEDKPTSTYKLWEQDVDGKKEQPQLKSILKQTESAKELSSSSGSPSKKSPKKKVRMDEPQKSETETEEEEEENAIKREARRLRREQKQKPPEFYDDQEDEENEKWAAKRREQKRGREPRPDLKPSMKPGRMEKDTDAVLSCPACMVTLTRDCQRHEIYKEQYRAMFVENVLVEDQQFVMPKTGKAKRSEERKRRKEAKAKGEIVPPVPENAIAPGDVFRPVRCRVCNTQVAVYDADEVFHFFNVLAGYA